MLWIYLELIWSVQRSLTSWIFFSKMPNRAFFFLIRHWRIQPLARAMKEKMRDIHYKWSFFCIYVIRISHSSAKTSDNSLTFFFVFFRYRSLFSIWLIHLFVFSLSHCFSWADFTLFRTNALQASSILSSRGFFSLV